MFDPQLFGNLVRKRKQQKKPNAYQIEDQSFLSQNNANYFLKIYDEISSIRNTGRETPLPAFFSEYESAFYFHCNLFVSYLFVMCIAIALALQV